MGYNAVIQQVVPEYQRRVKPAIALTSEIMTIAFDWWLDASIAFSDLLEDLYRIYTNPK